MFDGEELFLILLAILAGAWCLVGPVVWLVTLSKMRRLDRETETNRGRIRQLEVELTRLRSTGTSPAAATTPAAAAGQAASLVERMQAAREKKPGPMPPVAKPATEPLADIWVEAEPTVAASGTRPEVARMASAITPAEAGAPTTTGDDASSWEEILAGKWLTWVGAVAMVIGAGLFFKYTIDHDLVGPTGRVVVGIIVGMAAFAGGAYAMLRNYLWLSQGIVAAAQGILYFSLFAAFRWYEPKVLSQDAAFVGMVLVTAAGLAFAGYFKAQATAILGLIGGFLTPIMLSTNVDAQVMLFSYILILDLGVLGLAGFRKWPAVQILAFLATAAMWLGWFGRWYDPTKLTPTLVLMTAFFLLFALLAVWYNVLRRKPADPGDFFLILATPILYFMGLYAVTNEEYFWLHGLMALTLAGTYLGLGVLALSRNPAGTNVVLSLGGIAASFLTLAVPLQLTGHWIVIAWAAESLLLVELGLRFGQPKLRYAGFGLLVVVQLILMQYTIETLDNPQRFDSRFTRPRVDPIAQEVLPNVALPAASIPASAGLPTPPVRDPVWTDIFNARSFSFLASAIALGVLAWEYRRRVVTAASHLVYGWLLAAVPITVLAMLLIETYAASELRRWLVLSFLGTSEVFIAATAFVLIMLAVTWGPRWLKGVGLGAFGLLALFLTGSFLTTLDQWRRMWSRLETDPDWWSMFLLNPRGMGFVAGIVAAVVAYVVYQRGSSSSGERDNAAGEAAGLGRQLGGTSGIDSAAAVPMVLGAFTFVTLLGLLTIETYAQGVIHDWGTATALSVTGVWAVYALAALVLGIMYRASALRLMALGLLVLTTGKVFLYDVWHLSKEIRTVAFIGLGVSLFATSFLYRRFRGRLREWMTPGLLAVLIPAAMWNSPRPAVGDDATGTSTTLGLAEQLTHRWPVDTTSLRRTGVSPATDGLVKIAIPPEIFAHARSDLADLRLFAHRHGGSPVSPPIEVPYVLIRPQDTSRTVQRKVTLLNLSERAGHTEFLLDLGDTAETVNEITVEVSSDDKNYERPVQVLGADRRDADEWNLVAKSGYVLDVTRPGHQLRVGKLSFPQSRFHFYKVSIDNQDQPPLRITGASVSDREQAFVPRHEFEGKIMSRDEDAEHKQSRVVIDLGHDRLPTLGLRLAIAFDGSFYRPVTLEVSDQPPGAKTSWRGVTSGHVYRIDRPGLQGASTELSYAETPGRYLRLTISNGDDRPVDIVSATAVGIDRVLVAERRSLRFDDPLSVALYAGSDRVASPSYDLSRTLGSVKTEKLTELKLGPVEPNPDFKHPTPPKPPWSEENKPMLWAITLGGVLVLGLLTAMLLMKAAKHGPPT